jgi:hypothetical protein
MDVSRTSRHSRFARADCQDAFAKAGEIGPFQGARRVKPHTERYLILREVWLVEHFDVGAGSDFLFLKKNSAVSIVVLKSHDVSGFSSRNAAGLSLA